MKANYKKNRDTTANGELALNLYDMNKQILHQMTAFNDEQLEKAKNDINTFAKKFTDVHYWMFLAKEISSFTILRDVRFLDSCYPDAFESLGDSVIELIKGWNNELVSLEVLSDHCEVWVRAEEETNCYLLFSFDEGVVDFYG